MKIATKINDFDDDLYAKHAEMLHNLVILEVVRYISYTVIHSYPRSRTLYFIYCYTYITNEYGI